MLKLAHQMAAPMFYDCLVALPAQYTEQGLCNARKSEQITPLLRELHWLKVQERIQFRLYVLAYRCLIGTAPSYLAETLQSTADV